MTKVPAIEGPKSGLGTLPPANRLRLPGVPVFNYHGLTESFAAGIPEAEQMFWLTPAQFSAHLAHIREARFRVLLLEELKEESPNSPGKARMAVVSFDDGLASDYEFAFPMLTEFGMRGVFFVNTSTVGQAGYLTWPRIAEMHRAGMSIQSHSHRHLDLTVLPTPALESELTDSKRRLEDHLGSPVEYLAAPHGLVSRRVVRSALANGYQAVCSTRCLPANPRSKVLTRITLHRDTTPEGFHALLTGKVSGYAGRLGRGLLYRPRTLAERLVGTVRYRWLRQGARVSR